MYLFLGTDFLQKASFLPVLVDGPLILIGGEEDHHAPWYYVTHIVHHSPQLVHLEKHSRTFLSI